MRQGSSALASTSASTHAIAHRRVIRRQSFRRRQHNAHFIARARAVTDPFADPKPRNVDGKLPSDAWRHLVQVGAGKRNREYQGEALTVRAFREEDVGAVATLLLESGMQGFPTERRTLEVYLANAVGAYPYGTYLVGEVGTSSEIVATVGVSFNEETRRKFTSLSPPSDDGYLSDLTVAVDKRGAGLGVAMLHGAEEFARAMGCEEMWLHVALKKPGVVTLYREHGYGVRGVDPGLFGWRGRLLMSRKM